MCFILLKKQEDKQYLLKGQCHEKDILIDGLNILISTFCVRYALFSLPYITINFLFASLNLLFNFENA